MTTAIREHQQIIRFLLLALIMLLRPASSAFAVVYSRCRQHAAMAAHCSSRFHTSPWPTVVGSSRREHVRTFGSAFHSLPGRFRRRDDALITQTSAIHKKYFSDLYMSAGYDDSEVTDDYTTTTATTMANNASNKTMDSTWNVPGLKKETMRMIQRCHKKIGKTNRRLIKAQEEMDRLTTSDDVTLEELENCPDVSGPEEELAELRDRLKGLNSLEESLQTLSKNKNIVLPGPIATLALSLDVDDQPPIRPERPQKKKKGPRNMEKSRKPYRRYYSTNNIEVRVGKKAEDNDVLTLQFRDNNDWWMHASGCAGSHVVIRCTDEKLNEQVVQDAAALAARQSKCYGSGNTGTIKVSLTRCCDVVKPPGAKAGLVMLKGKVRTIAVNMREAQARLDRLEETVMVN